MFNPCSHYISIGVGVWGYFYLFGLLLSDKDKHKIFFTFLRPLVNCRVGVLIMRKCFLWCFAKFLASTPQYGCKQVTLVVLAWVSHTTSSSLSQSFTSKKSYVWKLPGFVFSRQNIFSGLCNHKLWMELRHSLLNFVKSRLYLFWNDKSNCYFFILLCKAWLLFLHY